MSSSNQDIDDFFDNDHRPQSRTSIFRMSSKSDLSEDESNVNSKQNLSPARTCSQSSQNKDNSISGSGSGSDSDTSSFSTYSGSSNYNSDNNQTSRYESSLDTRKNDCSPTKKVIHDIWTTTKRAPSR